MGGHLGRAYLLPVPAVPLSTKRLQLKGCAETLAYTGFPQEHWRRIRANNAIERTSREIRRRTRVVGTFPDGRSVDGKVFYRRCGKDSFQVHGNDFFLTRDKE